VTIRVVVVDDQDMVRAGFAALLSAEPDLNVVGEAADGADAIEVVRRTAPDVVLMDVRMPVLDGLAAAKVLLADDDGPRVVMLTTFDLDDYLYEALAAGVSGFLLKHSPPADLAHAVRVAAAGDALLSPSLTRRLIETAVRARSKPLGGQPPPASPAGLTQREAEVLVLVARGMSNTEIACALVVAEQTIKTHVSRILAKLGRRDRAQLVVYAYETGVVAPSGPADPG
jgi:DNA-binding NarL/FixJ family response regulator